MKCPHCGSHPRSNPDHNRFFGLIARAFEQWPSTHPFKPRDEDHLRSWLLCAADWKTTAITELPDGLPDEIYNVLKDEIDKGHEGDEDVFRKWVGHRLYVHRAKSIKFKRADQKKFNPIRDAVTEIIEQVIGVSADQLLKEKAA